MKFELDGKMITLQGLSCVENQVVNVYEFHWAAKKKGIFLEMIPVERSPHIQLNIHLQIQ